MSEYTYAWPSSKLTPSDMKLLHDARENSPEHTSITRLIAEAVRAQYGHLTIKPEPSSEQERESALRPAA